MTLGYDATTSLTSLSWCNSRGVNSIHHCHYIMALADSKFDDTCFCLFPWKRSNPCIFVSEQSRHIQHLQPRQRKKVWKLSFFTLKLPPEAKKIEIFPKFQRWMKRTIIFLSASYRKCILLSGTECHIINYLLTELAWAVPRNIGPRSLLYGPRCARSVLSRPRAIIPQVGPRARLVRG